MKNGIFIVERVLLYIGFVLLLVACTTVLIAALENHCYSLERLEPIMTRALQQVKLLDSAGTDLSASTKAALAQLDAEQKKTIDSNTLTFLFEMFAISVVVIAGYLLKVTQDKVQDTDVARDNAEKAAMSAEKSRNEASEANASAQTAVSAAKEAIVTARQTEASAEESEKEASEAIAAAQAALSAAQESVVTARQTEAATREVVRNAFQIMNRMGPFVSDVGETFVTSSLFQLARYATDRLCDADMAQLGRLKPAVVDSYTFLRRRLERISNSVGINQAVYDSFLDQVVFWRESLRIYGSGLASQADQGSVKELIADCDQIVGLLRQGNFVATYNRNLATLTADAQVGRQTGV